MSRAAGPSVKRVPQQGAAPLQATVALRVVPNAKRSEVVGEYGAAIKLKIAAPALDGKANQAVREFLAETLGLPLRDIVLLAGDKSRDKVVAVTGLDAATLRQRLLG